MDRLPEEWLLFRERVQHRAVSPDNDGALAIVMTPKGVKAPRVPPPGMKWQSAAKVHSLGLDGLSYAAQRETLGDENNWRVWYFFICGNDNFRKAIDDVLTEGGELFGNKPDFLIALAKSIFRNNRRLVKAWPVNQPLAECTSTRSLYKDETLDTVTDRLAIDLTKPFASIVNVLSDICPREQPFIERNEKFPSLDT